LPGCRVGSHCSPTGFAAVAPLPGCRTVVAVGRIGSAGAGPGGGGGGDGERIRSAMRALLADHALVEGHDPWTLLHRTNAALSLSGLGRLDALALISRGGDGQARSVVAVGRPVPLVVTADHLCTPVEGCLTLNEGWAVVLGTPDEGGGPFPKLLSPADVRTALALCDRPVPPRPPTTDRTLLAVVLDQ
jgi:hypothetical protein